MTNLNSNPKANYSAEPKKLYLFDLQIDQITWIVCIDLLVQYYGCVHDGGVISYQ